MADVEGDRFGIRAESDPPPALPVSPLLQAELGQISMIGETDLPREETQYPAESQR